MMNYCLKARREKASPNAKKITTQCITRLAKCQRQSEMKMELFGPISGNHVVGSHNENNTSRGIGKDIRSCVHN